MKIENATEMMWLCEVITLLRLVAEHSDGILGEDAARLIEKYEKVEVTG